MRRFIAPKYVAGFAILSGSLGAYSYIQRDVLSFYTLGAIRFGRAAVTAAKIVFDYKISLRGLDSSTEEYASIQSQVHTRSAQKLKDLCYKNGGCFVKVGQHLGSLDYLLPFEYVQEMKVFHKNSSISSIMDLKDIFKKEIQKDVDEVFSYFDETPLASASLAQVHRAKLKSGEDVVVKIQHPDVWRNAHTDMFIMESLFTYAGKLFKGFEFGWLADETRKNLPLELDFTHEGQNCERAHKLFGHLPFLKIPKIYWETTSNKVLTMEFCNGSFINDKQFYEDNKVDPQQVISHLSKLYNEMIFIKGIIHCDPHPGNLLVEKVNGKTRIVLLDHGLYQNLPNDVRLDYCNMWMSILNGDTEGMKIYSKKLGISKMYPLFACILTGRTWRSVSSGLAIDYSDIEDEMLRKSVPIFFKEINKILNKVPRSLLLILKTNDLVRGLERSLNSRPGISSFLSMSMACSSAIHSEKLNNCRGLKHWFYYKMSHYWNVVKFSVALYYIQFCRYFNTCKTR